MAKNRWTLWFIREDTHSCNRLRFSRLKAASFVLTLFILIGGAAFAASKYLAQRMTRISMSEVLRENQDLRRQIVGITKRLKGIDGQLQELYTSDDRLRLFADIPRIDQDVREVGIGGAVAPTLNFSEKDSAVHQLIFDLDKIEREIRLQKESFLEIQKKFIERADLIRHTPSLRPCQGGFISSDFGFRPDPFTGERTHHNGIDISVDAGTPVVTSADGVVAFAKRSPGFGNMVIIDHGYGFRTAYGHLNRIRVKKGERVERGQRIGDVGNSGRSTGPHLHYEVQINEESVDPMDYLYDSFAMLP